MGGVCGRVLWLEEKVPVRGTGLGEIRERGGEGKQGKSGNGK